MVCALFGALLSTVRLNTDSAVRALARFSHRASSCGLGALRSPLQFALPGPGRGDAAIRLRPLRSTCFRCTLFSVRLSPRAEPRPSLQRGGASRRPGCGPPSQGRRLRRLEGPSPKTLRSLTPIVAPGHHRFGSKPTGSFRTARLSDAQVWFHPRGQDRPTALPERRLGSLLSRRGWRNDPRRLLSCRVPCELARDRFSVPAAATRRLAAPDRIGSGVRAF